MILKEIPLVVQNHGKRNVVGKATVERHGDTIEIHGKIENPAYVRFLNNHPEEFSIASKQRK